MKNNTKTVAPWLAGVPKEWEIRKIKHFFTVVNGSTPKSSESTYWDGNITWITPADYKTEDKYICSSKKTITQEGLNSCSTSKVPAGSILVSNRAPIGSIGIAEKELCTSQGCKSLVKANEINEEYIYYYLSVMSGPLNMLGRGTTFLELSSNDLANFLFPLPTAKEQEAIVKILNKKIAAINDVICNKTEILELLQEQKASVICTCVIKGISSTAAMKDSGIDWLGQIPAHWRVVPAKALFAQSKETRHETDIQLTASQKYGIISQEDYMERQNYKIVLADKGLENWKHVEPNDFIISLRSFQGGLEISYIPGCITWHYIVLKPKAGVEPEYFKWLFKSPRYIQALQRTANFIRDGQDLRFSNFVQVPLPLIPMDEQKEIAEYLNKETARIDSIIADITEQIEKLKEYRQSVISEVVTGKVAVE